MSRNSIIVPEGIPFIAVPAIFALTSWFAGYPVSATLLTLITAFVLWFFRNPERKTPDAPGLVISPADGKVIFIGEAEEADILKGRAKKISIFMNVFNVHVNRIPCSGTVEGIRYYKGKFLVASLDKASSDNERNAVLIRTEDGKKILTIQIAGLVARRIVCWLKEGMNVTRGERFGLIRFGSRLDVFLPLESAISVKVGDVTRAGETPLGVL
ncbi:MAG: phosphatidylserine decarboxylase family protein [Deltaproteobacteria bacterium HGW-Deltaproteobacteria-19]|jgi:phosphatidylserine decarboxylase|nr:MAG: phosphatidylserine decarboxylase family protein [Deltaproteobacteria bacterium HGW-Deltaproteobacteria-19]